MLNKILLLLTLVIIGCSPVSQEDKFFPSDYLFAQRSFPFGEIDQKAYRQSIAQLDSYRQSTHKFTEPWTFEGPTNICGRITDIEMPVDDMQTIYAGTASGGVYKSDNQGTVWTQIFDGVPVQSIGDMAIDKSDTDVIYVGTGESNAGGGSLAYDGLGVYRSEDAGVTWESRGLEDVGSIGRIVIDPNDNQKVLVAAMGSLFRNNEERGVYRTQDGGENWEQILFVSDSTGAIDLAIHPQDGNIIYAAMWQRIRRPHTRMYGGATSGIYKSVDGGDSWTELTNDLPTLPENKGRIGLAISESQPNTLYAYYANTDGPITGIYRTDDAGETWTSKSIQDINNVPFIWWFGRISVNPTNPDDVYVTSITAHRSQDGGDTWTEVFENAHVDHHTFFIHPQDDNLVVNGNDGGVYLSDNGNPVESTYLTGMSNFQFYACEINPHNPDIILGGSQDNGTNTNNGAVDSWQRIWGGDGFRVIVDPRNENNIYAESQRGNIVFSRNGGLSFGSATQGLTGNSNWNTPIVMDPDDSNILYTGRQNLFRSTNGAESWSPISPSLVNPNNPQGINTFGTITTIDVSTHDSEVIYAGTDDGNVWITRDGGQTYNNISANIPERWITAVTHDPIVASGVYVTVSGFRFGDAVAQVLYSNDYGDTWREIGENLPDIPVNDIIADDRLPGKVYVATDIGVFVGENRGDWWAVLGEDLPVVPVTDLDFDAGSRKLAAATYGRGIYTYDLPDQASSVKLVSDKVYVINPNPVSDYLDVSNFVVDNSSVSIFDFNGQKVLEQSGKLIDVQSLISGTYLLRRVDGQTTKFVKL